MRISDWSSDVCSSDLETYRRDVASPTALTQLGPDLCLPESLAESVLDDIVRRSHRLVRPEATVGEALLDQQIAAGIGNVYKSEACFAVGLDPTTPIGEVDDEARRRVWSVAASQLQSKLHRAARVDRKRDVEGKRVAVRGEL